MYKPTKPDCDNELKAVLDSMVLAGVLTDDNLVVRATVESCWSEKEGGPRVTVTVSRVAGAPWP
jgi:Holliday junction resolvase RusA-like endonuclease